MPCLPRIPALPSLLRARVGLVLVAAAAGALFGCHDEPPQRAVSHEGGRARYGSGGSLEGGVVPGGLQGSRLADAQRRLQLAGVNWVVAGGSRRARRDRRVC